jgi:hypothetical protein
MKYSRWLLFTATIVINACASSHASQVLAPVAAPSAPSVPVVAPATSDALADFEWRRVHAGGGHFLRESLHSVQNASLISVLRMQLPGFATQRGAVLLPSMSESCSLDTYVNGLWAPEAANDLRARDVEAVEYYEAATAPPRYRRAGHACPVLLIWLRQ